MGCKPHKCPPRAPARLIAKALRSVATMQGVKLADENCASNLSVAEASEFLVRFFQKNRFATIFVIIVSLVIYCRVVSRAVVVGAVKVIGGHNYADRGT